MRKYEIIIMESKELNRNVKVYVLVPDGYLKSNVEYPVLYVNDGNVLFNDFEEVDLTWGMMDKYLNLQEKQEVIIVGIGSGETRNDELFPFVIERKDKEPIGGNTDSYMSYLIHELKPYIDQNYRTKKEADYTGLLGVSVGGACSLYAAMKYTDSISRFAFVSSAHYPVQEKMIEAIKTANFDGLQKLYSDIGTEEHENEKAKETYLRTNKEVYEVLKERLRPDVYMLKVIEGSKHEFVDWNERFPEMIEFLFS